MAENHNNIALKAMTYNGSSVKKWYHDGVLVFSAGALVTYYIDGEENKKTEEISSGSSALEPTTFVPEKDGWTFYGWREDTTASGDVLTEVVGSEPITLYAVFSKDVTLTTIANGKTSTSTQQIYYNNGNTADPAFTVSDPTKSGTTFVGWSKGASDTTVSYTDISGLSLSEDLTLYAVFKYANGTETQTHRHTPDTTSTTITLPNNAANFQWRVKGQNDVTGRTAYINPYQVFTSGLNKNDSSDALLCDGHWTSWSTTVYTAPFTFSVIAYYAENMILTIEKSYIGKTVVG